MPHRIEVIEADITTLALDETFSVVNPTLLGSASAASVVRFFTRLIRVPQEGQCARRWDQGRARPMHRYPGLVRAACSRKSSNALTAEWSR